MPISKAKQPGGRAMAVVAASTSRLGGSVGYPLSSSAFPQRLRGKRATGPPGNASLSIR